MRPPSPRAAWLLCAPLLMAGLAWGPAACAGERLEREAPVLILPGDHVVRPGEWIELRWTRADEISEMEILLSRDGGRSYAVCISPQLDPRRFGFRWRVPETTGDQRMRIRFNRDGREIEGAPSAPLRVVTGESGPAQPLGLPPIERTGSSREPRPPGERSEGQPGRAAAGAASGRPASDPARAPASGPAPGPTQAPAPDSAAPRPPQGATPFAAPRSLPLRS
jgi:hypothetical protein